VGDPDQLASVEAGAVLADLVAPALDSGRTDAFATRLSAVVGTSTGSQRSAPDTPAGWVRDGVAVLRTVRRFDSGGVIASLAEAIRSGDGDRVLEVLRGGGSVAFHDVADETPVPAAVLAAIRADVVAVNRDIVAGAAAGDAQRAIEALGRHRLLCAHRRGPRGVAQWEQLVQRWLVEDLGIEPRRDGRYAGLPLLVTANDYDNGLYNGDTGVVLDHDGVLVAAFDRVDKPLVLPLGRLSDVRPLHAMTVHRGQGSQFDAVTVILPPVGSPLGTREMLYTAVTRATDRVVVIGSADSVRASVARPVARASGLRARLH
jgi:exodeoxyribonuclease V alpha subunit